MFFLFTLYLISTTLCINICNMLDKNHYIFQYIKALQISTSSNQKYNNDFNINILNQCELNNYFQSPSKTFSAIDTETIQQRTIRFKLKQNPNINNSNLRIHLHSNINILSNTSFILNSDEEIYTSILYSCKNITKATYNIIINLTINNTHIFNFQISKICSFSISDSVDLSHLVLLLVTIGIIVISTLINQHSTFEDTYLNKFPELRNPYHSSIILITIIIILYFFSCIKFLHIWIHICSIITIPSSFAVICELLLNITYLKRTLPNYFFNNTIFKLFSFDFIIFYIIGLLFYVAYYLSLNWILCNILAICLGIVLIRLFKFTSMKYLIILLTIVFIYEFIWMIFYCKCFSKYTRFKFEKEDMNFFNIPFFIVCPEINFTLNDCFLSVNVVDIILPGIFIDYLRRFDVKIKYFSMFYYLVSFCVFICGLLIRIGIYNYLYYPIPCFGVCYPLMVGIVMGIAYNKGELREMMEGFKETVFAENEFGSGELKQIVKYAYIDSLVSMSNNVEMKILN